VQPPPAPRRKLLRFGTGQQHRKIERAQERRLFDPAARFNKIALHQRDLPRRPAKAQPADAQKGARQRSKRGFRHREPSCHANGDKTTYISAVVARCA